jgi:uncharacterized protein
MGSYSTSGTQRGRRDGVLPYFLLACAITWSLALPAVSAWLRHAAPSHLAVACAGLSAFGPLIAATAVAWPRGLLREVFGHWRTPPHWVLVALLVPLGLHLSATFLFVLVGGRPEQWLYPPATAEHVAALIVFPLGEEFGWRGFAHAPLVHRLGAVRGSLAVGLGWGIWHLGYSVTPQAAGFDVFGFALTMLELPLYAVLIAWLFERAGRSMWVALAFHAGGHLDHLERAPHEELLRHALHIAVLALAAALAARSLSRMQVGATPPRALS